MLRNLNIINEKFHSLRQQLVPVRQDLIETLRATAPLLAADPKTAVLFDEDGELRFDAEGGSIIYMHWLGDDESQYLMGINATGSPVFMEDDAHEITDLKAIAEPWQRLTDQQLEDVVEQLNDCVLRLEYEK
jgi:hypothetical protein